MKSEEKLDKKSRYKKKVKKKVSPPSHAMEGWLERLSEQTGWLIISRKFFSSFLFISTGLPSEYLCMQVENHHNLKAFFDEKVDRYNQPNFIAADPICIPHLFSKKQDIEIAGFFAAIFAWGNRTTIINKSKELMHLMDMTPHDFCLNHSNEDLKKLLQFKHRTFNATDLLYSIEFLKHHYSKQKSLESAFFSDEILKSGNQNIVELGLIHFHEYFFSLEDAPNRTRKHIATPYKNSGCKRLNMYLRWMVRNDKQGVDFGIWKKIKPSMLICPIDVHVARVAKRFQLLDRKQADWTAAIELTQYLRNLDPNDPVKYDFALFGLGVMEKYS